MRTRASVACERGLPGGFRVAVFSRPAGIRMIGAPALTPQEVQDGRGTWS